MVESGLAAVGALPAHDAADQLARSSLERSVAGPLPRCTLRSLSAH